MTTTKYYNGNCLVSIDNEGTKIREYNSTPKPKFPESIDLKITNSCSLSNYCKWCHEGSSLHGGHGAILNMPWAQTLTAGTELAIGGGNPLSHPNLTLFLCEMKRKGVICNITVNELHLNEYQNTLKEYIREDLIKGLGISYSGMKQNVPILEELVSLTKNIVFHVIAGVNKVSCLKEIQTIHNKVLILGYKEFRKGKDYYSQEVEDIKYQWYIKLYEYFKSGLTLSFDNLAIEQLKLKRFLPDQTWNTFYMGDDGQFTMYIDAVKNEFAKSSTSDVRYQVEQDIRYMFKTIRQETYD